MAKHTFRLRVEAYGETLATGEIIAESEQEARKHLKDRHPQGIVTVLEEEFGMNEDQFVKIANHLQGQLDHLDKVSAAPDSYGQHVTFEEYKVVYDTLIALRQAQALEKIAGNLEYIVIHTDEIPELETIAERLSRIGSIILDK